MGITAACLASSSAGVPNGKKGILTARRISSSLSPPPFEPRKPRTFSRPVTRSPTPRQIVSRSRARQCMLLLSSRIQLAGRSCCRDCAMCPDRRCPEILPPYPDLTGRQAARMTVLWCSPSWRCLRRPRRPHAMMAYDRMSVCGMMGPGARRVDRVPGFRRPYGDPNPSHKNGHRCSRQRCHLS